MTAKISIEKHFTQTPKLCPVCGAWLPKASRHKRVGDELHSIAHCETEGCGHKETVTRFARRNEPKHNPQMPSIAPLSPFQDSMRRVYVFGLKPRLLSA